MVERGIYDLSVWVAGMKQLPPAKEIPICFRIMQFSEMPKELQEVKKRYKQLVKSAHPDAGGSEEQFSQLQEAYNEAAKYYEPGGEHGRIH